MRKIVAIIIACLSASTVLAEEDCTGAKQVIGEFNSTLLTDGSIAGWARNHVNVDGMRTAYHKVGTTKGAMTTVCNAGEAFLPNGTSFHGAHDCNAFIELYRTALKKGWKDPDIGAIRWYGVVGTDEATIAGRTVKGVIPTEQPDNSGFFVSPTKLADSKYKVTNQQRYLNAEVIPYATITDSNKLTSLGIKIGTFGVAYNRITQQTVTFVVGDIGPRVGEGSFALSKMLAGEPNLLATKANLRRVSIDAPNILWVLFGTRAGLAEKPYTDVSIKQAAAKAFDAWGGTSRLDRCIANGQI